MRCTAQTTSNQYIGTIFSILVGLCYLTNGCVCVLSFKGKCYLASRNTVHATLIYMNTAIHRECNLITKSTSSVYKSALWNIIFVLHRPSCECGHMDMIWFVWKHVSLFQTLWFGQTNGPSTRCDHLGWSLMCPIFTAVPSFISMLKKNLPQYIQHIPKLSNKNDF